MADGLTMLERRRRRAQGHDRHQPRASTGGAVSPQIGGPDSPASLPQAGPSAPPPAAGLPLPCLLVLAGVAAAVVGQGAFYEAGQRMVVVLVAAAAVSAGGGVRLAEVARRPLNRMCAALGSWAVSSAGLAGDMRGALSTVLLLAGVVVVVETCRRLDAQQRDQLVVAVVAVGVLVSCSGLAGVAWRRSPWALEDQGLWRAATTLTYANAAAGLLATVALLSLARAVAVPRSVLAAAANCLLLAGLGATLSRGGFVAFGVGVLVLARALGPRVVLRGAIPAASGAAVALAGLSLSIPAGSPARPGWAAAALVAGLLLAAVTARLDRRPLPAVAVLASLAGAGGIALALGVGGPAADAARDIARPRLTIASPDRTAEARAALHLAADRPLTGVGPGHAHLSWSRPDGAVLHARYAHNEYLQTLAELGVIGLVLLLGLLGAVARTVRRARPTAPSPEVWAGVAAGLAALAVHGLFDFGWHLPAIPLTAALLVGIVTNTERENQS
jgi:O-antigen ligase